MKLPLYNQIAKEVGEVEVNDSIFASDVNDKILSQYVYIYLSNQRQSNAHTKTKAEVRGGGKKPFNQKGTGRARAGSSRSPLWKGGGVTFGPTNNINWKRKTTKSFRAAAFRNAFSKLQSNNLIKILEGVQINKEEALTKQALEMINNFENPKKLTIIAFEKNEDLLKSFANLKKNRVISVSELSVYDLLNGGKILIEQKALDYINKWAK